MSHLTNPRLTIPSPMSLYLAALGPMQTNYVMPLGAARNRVMIIPLLPPHPVCLAAMTPGSLHLIYKSISVSEGPGI